MILQKNESFIKLIKFSDEELDAIKFIIRQITPTGNTDLINPNAPPNRESVEFNNLCLSFFRFFLTRKTMILNIKDKRINSTATAISAATPTIKGRRTEDSI